MANLKDLQKIAEVEFKDMVEHSFIKDYKLRIILKDGSFIDIFLSRKLKDKFGFHWECTDGKIFRYDNFPDKKAKKLKSFPFHFHYEKQENIQEVPFRTEIENGFRDFLNFVREKIKENLRKK
ncbi:toxin-antitoxin system TumE family protein [Persephonella sp.]